MHVGRAEHEVAIRGEHPVDCRTVDHCGPPRASFFTSSAVRGDRSDTLRLTSRQALSLVASSARPLGHRYGIRTEQETHRRIARPARSCTTWATRCVFVDS